MMHDGRFIHVDPWGHASIWSQISGSIIWDIYPSVLLYTAIATIVTCINALTRYDLSIPSTMLTVLGTVIGFVVSYRTHSAYDRFLEGAVLWGNVITSSRKMARLIWFHVPNQLEVLPEGHHVASEADQAQVLIEKKTMLNLIEAHVVALKHYLRGEGGTFYEDLYPVTCHLPRYAMPNSVPIARPDLNGQPGHNSSDILPHGHSHSHSTDGGKHPMHYFGEKPTTEEPHSNHEGHGGRHSSHQRSQGHLAVPGESSTAPNLQRTHTAPPGIQQDGQHPHHKSSHHGSAHSSVAPGLTSILRPSAHPHAAPRRSLSWSGDTLAGEASANGYRPLHTGTDNLRHRVGCESPPATHGPRSPPQPLLPSRLPPPWTFIDDVMPFLGPFRTLWRKVKNQLADEESKRRRNRKHHKNHTMHDDNLPLQIQLYFSAYVSLLQRRKVLDVPTTTALIHSIDECQHTLTSLEKIVTTPIPFSYLIHLKHSTWLYLALLPFQLERYLGWVTIPACCVAAFLFLGFLGVASQIEGPFGYDANDLDLDTYVHEIVTRELQEIAAHPPAGVDDFIFLHSNEPFFPADTRSARQLVKEHVSPMEIRKVLLKGHERDLGWRSFKSKRKHSADEKHSDAV